MKKIYKWVAGGIVVLLTATTLEFFTSTQPRNTSSRAEETSESAPSQDRVNSAWAPTQAPSMPPHHKTPPETRQVLDSLLAQFNSTRSYRQFVAEAMKNASRGGFLYAMSASQDCESFQSPRDPNLTPITSDRAMAAAAFLQARCDIDVDDFQRHLSAAIEGEGARLDSDPLIGILMPKTFNESQDDDLRRAKALLETGDPIAMQSLI